jgi:hypothetical protein
MGLADAILLLVAALTPTPILLQREMRFIRELYAMDVVMELLEFATSALFALTMTFAKLVRPRVVSTSQPIPS